MRFTKTISHNSYIKEFIDNIKKIRFTIIMFYGFPPVYDKNSKVLILGSFPSVKSRLEGFYYGNPQNRFWKTLERIFNEKIPNDIEKKKQFLLKHKITLYDIVEQSDITGSSDISLEKSKKKISDISFLLPPHTQIEKIICNGKTSYSLLTQNIQTTLPIIYLPSTSSANPTYNFESWQKELSFLLD